MLPRIYLVGVWSGVIFVVLYSAGMLLAGLIPPPSALASAADVANYYQGNTFGIRLGMVFAIVASACSIPWVVTISALIRRMEGDNNFLSQVQLIGGVAETIMFLLPALIWAVASFRPDTNPDILRMLNDAAWLIFMMPVEIFFVQFIPLIAAMLLDRNKPSLFPRWLPILMIAANVVTAFGIGALFFKSGPFAWGGSVTFWAALIGYFLWEDILLFYAAKIILAPASGYALRAQTAPLI